MDKPRYRPRFGYDIRIKRETAPTVHACAIPGCTEEATSHLPLSPHNPTRTWLCKEHARTHNERWDYFSGMSEAEILKFQEEALFGHRPTWPMGKRGAGMRDADTPRTGHFVFEDDTVVFSTADRRPPPPRRPHRVLTPMQQQAFEILELDSSVSLNEIKARYKELVKRFHPDANGGDRGTEERLRQVIKAYGVLRASGLA